MDKVLVINLTAVTQHVGVIHANGVKDDVQIVPRKRVELRTGMIVDPAWLGRNPDCVRVVKPQVLTANVTANRKPEQQAPIPTTLTVADLQPDGAPAGQLTVADLDPVQEVDDKTTEGEAQ
jgi:hypothetical protein